MDIIANCACFQCCFSSDKGSYNTYDREKRQPKEQNGSVNQNQDGSHPQDCPQHLPHNNNKIETPTSKNMGK